MRRKEKAAPRNGLQGSGTKNTFRQGHHTEAGERRQERLPLPSLHYDLGGPTQSEVDWLQAHGVSRNALANPWPIGACNARFDGRLFELDAAGERAITILIDDTGVPVDIAAWQPRTGKVASYLGTAFAIGQDTIFSPATYFAGRALHVHASPLEWLQEGRRGIVVLRPEWASAMLGKCERLSVSSIEQAAQLRQQIWRPPVARVLVRQRRSQRAAA